MSFAIAAPDLMAVAARDLAGIGSAISAANAAAAGPTAEILAAAADEVSTQIAALFGAYADGYRMVTAQAAAFHDTFVQAVSAGAASYASAEANAAALLGTPLTATSAAATSFIMGGTFNPQPAPSYVAAINN